MTKLSNYLVNEINITPVENFIREQKEILAVDFIHTNIKTFRTVDLWNIQRQRKRRVQKRMFSQAGL